MPKSLLPFSRLGPLQYITEYFASLCRISQSNYNATFTALIIQELQSLRQQPIDHSLTRCLTCDTVAHIGWTILSIPSPWRGLNHQMIRYPISSSNISSTGSKALALSVSSGTGS
ncbi:hypothetical protein BDW66DRAFT_134080 [Aspergillus desertorum]